MYSLAEDRVPASWAAVAYPSLRGLQSWLQNLLARVQQLVEWTADHQARAGTGIGTGGGLAVPCCMKGLPIWTVLSTHAPIPPPIEHTCRCPSRCGSPASSTLRASSPR